MQRTPRLMDLPVNYFWKWYDTQPQKLMHFMKTPRLLCTQNGDVTKLEIKNRLPSSIWASFGCLLCSTFVADTRAWIKIH